MSDELRATQIDRDYWFKMWETARAELAAEREKRGDAQAEVGSMQNHINRLTAEHDELRALLREAGDWLTPDPADDQLLARIDAALGGHGDA